MRGTSSVRILGAAAVLLAVACGTAHAGFVIESIDIELPGGGPIHAGPPPWAHGPPNFLFAMIPADPGKGLLEMDETYGGMEALSLMVLGETDADPVMTVRKNVENDSGVTWYGYVISMPATEDETFVGTPTCDKLNYLGGDDRTLIFGGDGVTQKVEPGETVQFQFDVLVTMVGLFDFTLTQEPYEIGQPPEPATLGLLATGLAGLLLRRRR
jgi:hypothetical protein